MFTLSSRASDSEEPACLVLTGAQPPAAGLLSIDSSDRLRFTGDGVVSYCARWIANQRWRTISNDSAMWSAFFPCVIFGRFRSPPILESRRSAAREFWHMVRFGQQGIQSNRLDNSVQEQVLGASHGCNVAPAVFYQPR